MSLFLHRSGLMATQEAPPVAGALIMNAELDSDADPRVAAFIASWVAGTGVEAQNLGTISHQPAVQLVAAASTGCLIATKNGTSPANTAYADFSDYIGQRIAILAEMAVDDQDASSSNTTGNWPVGANLGAPDYSASFFLRAASDATGASFVTISGTTTYSAADIPLVRRHVALDYTVTSERPFIGVRSRKTTSTGGSGGGHPNLTRFLVAEYPYDFSAYAWA